MDISHIRQQFPGINNFLVASNGQFLGRLTLNEYASDSIYNQYGSYGSEYSSTSIFNQYSPYGSEYSSLSPFNPYTSTPPYIILNGTVVGRLTVNPYVFGSEIVKPEELKMWLNQKGIYY